MRALVLIFLSGCLYVSTNGDPIDLKVGTEYECHYRKGGMWKTENICGPHDAAQEILDSFHVNEDPGTKVTCTETVNLCSYDDEN